MRHPYGWNRIGSEEITDVMPAGSYRITRPIAPYDPENPMHVIGHHHEFVQNDIPKMTGQFIPTGLHDFPPGIRIHDTIMNFAEQAFPVFSTHREIIRIGTTVIVPGEAEGSSI